MLMNHCALMREVFMVECYNIYKCCMEHLCSHSLCCGNYIYT